MSQNDSDHVAEGVGSMGENGKSHVVGRAIDGVAETELVAKSTDNGVDEGSGDGSGDGSSDDDDYVDEGVGSTGENGKSHVVGRAIDGVAEIELVVKSTGNGVDEGGDGSGGDDDEAYDDNEASDVIDEDLSPMKPWESLGRAQQCRSGASVLAETQIRRRRQVRLSEEKGASASDSEAETDEGHHGPGVSYHTVSYELIDTPVWHRRTVEMMSKGEEGRRCQHCRRHGTKLTGIERHHRQMKYVYRLYLVGLGVVAAGIGFLIAYSADNLLLLKIRVATGEQGSVVSPDSHTGAGFGFFVGLNVLFALAAHVPVALRPVSAGSGIAEAKAVLNGIVIPGCTDVLTAAAKGVSVIFAAASGLPVGLEGPMIFIGLSLGENLSRAIPRRYAHVRTERERRDLAAVGTTVGVSIAFYAPVAGVLFALEEGCSYVSTLLIWKCFAASCVTVITAYFFSSCEEGFPEPLDVWTLAKFNGLDGEWGNYEHPKFAFWEYFVFVLMGIAGGVLGACFIELNRALTILRRRLSFGRVLKCLEVVVLTVIMSTLAWWIPDVMSRCGSLENVRADEEYFRQFGCPDGQYNELATLLLNPVGPTGINLLFWEGKEVFSASTCIVAGVIYLLMLLVLFGTAVGMGIFIPLLYIGACFGRALGLWWDSHSVSTYAIVGSCAMLAGVARVLISLTAIMMQTTGLPYFVTPFMVVTILARVVGRWCFGREGIYDVILELKGIPFLEERAPPVARQTDLRAACLLSPEPLVTLRPEMKVCDLIEVLKTTPHVEYPVVDPAYDGMIVGVVKKEHLLTVLDHKKALYDSSADMSSSQKTLSYDELVKNDSYVPEIGEVEAVLTEDDLLKYVDITPYAQVAPHTFEGCGSAERAYEMFRTLGLRSMIVLGPDSKPMGAITRRDLKILEEIGVDEKKIRNIRNSVGTYAIS